MNQNTTYHPYKKIVLISIAFVGGIVLLSLLIMLLQRIFYRNPFGEEIRIDNFSSYFSDTPTEQQEMIFHGLYNAVARNTADPAAIPKSGALIRADTVTSESNPETQVNYGTFIVDLAALEQSYRVQFEWSPEAGNPNLSGYAVLVTCPAAEFVIYPDFVCTDELTEENERIEEINTEYPIMKDLPIKIDYFAGGYGKQTRYDIEGDLNTYENGENTFKIIITDYSGGNYEAALTRIRDLGYNPDDYTIEYTDLSQAMSWGYAN